MTVLHRVVIWMTLVGLMSAGAAVAYFGITQVAEGYDRQLSFFEAIQSIEEEQQRAAALRRVDAEVVTRVRAKQEVIDRLMNGRITFWAAATAFRKTLRENPIQLNLVVQKYTGGTTDERVCRNVIDFVRVNSPAGPILAARFEAEVARRAREAGGRLSFADSE